MKILVLGANGHIGDRLIMRRKLEASGQVICGVRRSQNNRRQGEFVIVDTLNLSTLERAMKGVDVVINCVAGNARAIGEGTELLTRTALTSGTRVIHLSTMSVYGKANGTIAEEHPMDPNLGWYARAKCEAESHVHNFTTAGGKAVIFRPGCVGGPGSELWVGRIARLLKTGRLGDIGKQGCGWTNLVHVDDVCAAIEATALKHPDGPPAIFNVAAPDSPDWRRYIMDVGIATNAPSIPQRSAISLFCDANLLGPPLKVASILSKKLGISEKRVPEVMPPGLIRLWKQKIRLDSTRGEVSLGMTYRPYEQTLAESANWYNEKYSQGIV